MVNKKINNQRSRVLVLHNIRSVHNVGSLFRTADAFGIDTIYLCGFTPTPYDAFGKKRSDFAKTALGSEDTVPFVYKKSASVCIKELQANGYTVIAVEQHKNSLSYVDHKVYSANKIALVLGNEVRGIDARICSLCDNVVEIPMCGHKESLNVSVAGALVISRACE